LSSLIGNILPTQIPDYTEAADIQAALKLYHYGSTTVPTVDQIGGNGGIVANSVAGHLKALDVRLDTAEAIGVGSDYVASEPQDPVDGFIWVDADADLATNYTIPSVIYQNSQPSSNLSSGMLWVDKDSSPLKMYVYDESLGWREIGA
jgi:hypothetical protein